MVSWNMVSWQNKHLRRFELGVEVFIVLLVLAIPIALAVIYWQEILLVIAILIAGFAGYYLLGFIAEKVAGIVLDRVVHW